MGLLPSTNGKASQRRWASVAMPTGLGLLFLSALYWQRPFSSQTAAEPTGATRLSSLVESYKPQSSDETVASLSKQMKEMKREIETLRRKSWSEHLDPQFHYRAKFFLDKTTPEDRGHVEPFYLGHMLNTTEVKRRVYIDLGMNSFESSVCYMLTTYPAQFDEVYAFECCTYEGEIKDGQLPPLQKEQVEQCVSQEHKYKSAKYTAKQVFSMTKLFWAYVDTKDDKTSQPPKISFNNFLDSLKLTEDDFVVLKMDIEGKEYDVISALLAEPRLSSLIDELMVEVHYAHPEMDWAYWTESFPGIDITDAHVIMQRARDAGIVVHPWP